MALNGATQSHGVLNNMAAAAVSAAVLSQLTHQQSLRRVALAPVRGFILYALYRRTPALPSSLANKQEVLWAQTVSTRSTHKEVGWSAALVRNASSISADFVFQGRLNIRPVLHGKSFRL